MLAAIDWTPKALIIGLVVTIPAALAVFSLAAQSPTSRVAFRRCLVPVLIFMLFAAFLPDLPIGYRNSGFARGLSIKLAWKSLSSEQRWSLRAQGAAWYLAIAIPITLGAGWFGRRYAAPG